MGINHARVEAIACMGIEPTTTVPRARRGGSVPARGLFSEQQARRGVGGVALLGGGERELNHGALDGVERGRVRRGRGEQLGALRDEGGEALVELDRADDGRERAQRLRGETRGATDGVVWMVAWGRAGSH
eukprot:2452194-Prymnesium_polylepis.1